jgi:3-deoxy-D-manno-octulosonate 8-phosphate phosphatase (KDO 8-P phosphatase)
MDVGSVMTGPDNFRFNGIETVFNVKDGHGIKMVQQSSIEVGIISDGNPWSETGLRTNYFPCLPEGIRQIASYREILAKTGLVDQRVAYIGDDIVGLRFAPGCCAACRCNCRFSVCSFDHKKWRWLGCRERSL